MSDDAPPTPVRPGVAATFYDGTRAGEQGVFVLLPNAEIALGAVVPTKNKTTDNFFVRMGGQIVFPTAGQYTFSVEGAPGDDVQLVFSGKKVLDVKKFTGVVTASEPITATAGEALPYRLEYRHGTGTGTLRLLWETPASPRQPVPSSALQDAWGRFITNDGKPSNWWLQLTRAGKEMMNGKRQPGSPLPQ